MNKTYYTLALLDEDGYVKDEGNCEVYAAASREAALRGIWFAHLMRCSMDDDCNLDAIDRWVGVVEWRDCWLKCSREGAEMLEREGTVYGVTVTVRRPGEHPGGDSYWAYPDDEVIGLFSDSLDS